MKQLLLVLVLACMAAAAWATDAYDYGAYDGYGEYDADTYLDDFNYMGDDDESYYDEYGFRPDYDGLGYDDNFLDDYATPLDSNISADCSTGADGKVQLPNGTATCDVRVSGVDKQADKLPGGLDGIYTLSGCHHGRPMYKRKDSPAGQERVLYYAKNYSDWDVSNGSTPNDDILLFGADVQDHIVPLFVPTWHLGCDLSSVTNATSADGVACAEDKYRPITASLSCADGKVAQPPAVAPAQSKPKPLLTPEEMDAKYRMFYDTYTRRPEPNPAVNLSFVIMLVMIGVTIVLALPYMLARRSRTQGKGYAPVSTATAAATSFVQVIQQSKKKQSGHIH